MTNSATSSTPELDIASALYEAAPKPVPPAIPNADPGVQQNLLDQASLKSFNASPKGRKLVQKIKDEYSRALNDRRQYEKFWALNLAMYAGRQYVQWDDQKSTLVSQPVVSLHTPRLVVNKIRPIIRTEMSKLTGQKPTATVMPASNDDQDVFAATAAQQTWDSLYERLKFQKVLSKCVFWTSITGTGYIKTLWNAQKYDDVSKLYGDIDWIALSPWNVLVSDLTEQDLDDMAWVMDVQTRPKEWVKETYGALLPQGTEPTTNRTDEVMSSVGLALGTKQDKPASTLIQEIWIKPNMMKELPEGGMITLVDDTIVQAAIHGIPYDHKRFPFAKISHIPTGRFYADSVIRDLIPLQREYNRTQNQIIEAKNRTAKPQMMYRDGSVDPTRITSQPGVWIPIKGSAEMPQPLPLQDLPSYVVNFNDRQKQDFEDISGQHAVTNGQAPAGMAATAISYLQEQDDSYLSVTYQALEDAIQEVAQQSLTLAATYWTVPRLIKATGDDGGWDALELRGAQIESATDIRIDTGSALPQSRSAKIATVNDWMARGYVPVPDGLQMLDMPMTQQFIQRQNADKKAAQWENILFGQLNDDEVRAFQDDQVGQAMQKLDAMHQQQSDAIAQDPAGTLAKQQQGGVTPAPESQNGSPTDALGVPTSLAPVPDAIGHLSSPSPAQTQCIIPVNDWDDHAIHIEIHNLKRKSPSYRLMPPSAQAELQKHVLMHQQALAAQQGGGPAPAGIAQTAPLQPGEPQGPEDMSLGSPGGSLNAPQPPDANLAPRPVTLSELSDPATQLPPQ